MDDWRVEFEAVMVLPEISVITITLTVIMLVMHLVSKEHYQHYYRNGNYVITVFSGN